MERFCCKSGFINCILRVDISKRTVVKEKQVKNDSVYEDFSFHDIYHILIVHVASIFGNSPVTNRSEQLQSRQQQTTWTQRNLYSSEK